jgi:hypothetical protein
VSRPAVPIATILTDLRANEELAARVVAGVSLDQGNWRPGANSWSIWQVFDHLARVNSLYGAALEQAISRAWPSRVGTDAVSPGALTAWFIRKLEPPVRTRMRSPEKGLPAGAGEVSEAHSRFLRSHEVLRTVAESAATADLNRIRFRNPFISVLRFTVGGGLLIVNAHDRRHLWQVAQIQSAPGYPAR